MPDPVLVTATRGGTHPPEAEPVLVEAGDNVVRLVLDDGETFDFDGIELRSAVFGPLDVDRAESGGDHAAARRR